eukprot:1624451-Karenia_brevis.AAC.1
MRVQLTKEKPLDKQIQTLEDLLGRKEAALKKQREIIADTQKKVEKSQEVCQLQKQLMEAKLAY